MAWSEERRQKASEVQKARWAAKRTESQNKNPETKQDSEPVADYVENITIGEPIPDLTQEQPQTPKPAETIASPDYADILKLVLEMQKTQNQWMAQSMGNQPVAANVQNGQLTGSVDKYTTDSEYYPNPIERLKAEPKLQRFAFTMNYDLNYNVSVVKYETVDHIRTREPRFQLELVRVVLDEYSGEPTSGRYVLCKLIMHEDPDAAIDIAQKNGLRVESDNEREFLDEMRYLRYREWLLDCFYPPKPNEESQRKDTVIEGKLVQYYEVSSESGKGLKKTDWENMTKIKF